MRSGFMRSETAQPSRRNSGLLTTSKLDSGLVVASDGVGDLFAGLDRYGAFVDDDPIFLEHLGDLASNFLDEGEIHAAVGLGWRRHRNENNLRMIDAVFDAVRKAQSAGGNIAMNDFFQAGFVNRDLPALQAIDLSLVVVDADDIVADIGEASTSHETDISRTNNRNIHSAPIPSEPLSYPASAICPEEGEANWISARDMARKNRSRPKTAKRKPRDVYSPRALPTSRLIGKPNLGRSFKVNVKTTAIWFLPAPLLAIFKPSAATQLLRSR